MQKILGGLKRGLVFIVSAPAGTGKTTLVRMLCKQCDCVVESVSYTTRAPRAGEVNGRDYHFVTREDFERRLAAKEFLEHAEVFGRYYGTPLPFIEQSLNHGKHVILVIDTQGAIQLMDQGFPAISIFISPPSLEVLRERLCGRRSEGSADIEERLSWSKHELDLIPRYDYNIVNDSLPVACDILRSILIAEEHRVRYSNL
jgi:guanylate kinase